jgi:lysophospholipase L1-like esterase
LFQLIRSKLPDVSIVYVSIKPSPVRRKYWNKMKQANLSIKRFLRKQRNTAFADIYGTMLNDDGSARTELYINDQLHMNESGYKIWQKIISPYLKNE